MCCSVLQCVAVCCSALLKCVGDTSSESVLQCVAVCCSVLQFLARCCWNVWVTFLSESMLQCGAVRSSVVQCGAVWSSVEQCGAVWCSVLIHCCSVLIN